MSTGILIDSCPKCRKGYRYRMHNRMGYCCDNPKCDYVLSIEDEMRGNSETDLKTQPDVIIQGLISEGRIPKDWNDKRR